ncbi:MAG: hypothetical protein R2867_26260 [Caldilineaceae bacterium]
MSSNLQSTVECCMGLQRYTPVEIDNRSGLTAILYRIGTQARFKATMGDAFPPRYRNCIILPRAMTMIFPTR